MAEAISLKLSTVLLSYYQLVSGVNVCYGEPCMQLMTVARHKLESWWTIYQAKLHYALAFGVFENYMLCLIGIVNFI